MNGVTTNRRIDAPVGLLMIIQCVSVTSTAPAMANDGATAGGSPISKNTSGVMRAEPSTIVRDDKSDTDARKTANGRKAKALFESGVALYSALDYAGAAVDFEKSLAALPTRMAYYNLANCYLALQKYGKAITALEKLRELFGDAIDDKWNQEISALEFRLQALAAKLSLEVQQSGASIRVNGTQRATTPVNRMFYLDPGTHELEIVKAGFMPYSRTLLLAPGDHVGLVISLMRRNATPPTVAPKQPTYTPSPAKSKRPAPGSSLKLGPRKIPTADDAENSGTELSVVFWTSAATAVATGALAAMFFAMAESEATQFRDANSEFSDFERSRHATAGDTAFAIEQKERFDALLDHKDDAELFGWLGVGFASATVVAGAVALISLLVDDQDEEPTAAGISSTTRGAVLRF